MSCVSDATLFPLPLVAFEHYLLADDRADYPTNFFFRLKFTGTFERAAFCSALETALARHPLLRAVVRESSRNRFEWVPADSPWPHISWGAGAGPCTCPAGPGIDLRNEVGSRIYLCERADETDMLWQFHHVCCDGLGAMQLVKDLLRAYHRKVFPDCKTEPLPPLDPQRLRMRGRFGMTPLGYLLRTHKELAGLLGAVEYFAHRPVSLASSGGVPPGDGLKTMFPATSAHTFTRSETKMLHRAAKKNGCASNDLLLRDLFLALHEWTLQHDPKSRKRVLRIMVPTNLRGPGDAAMPAADVVSMVFLDRRLHRFSSPRRLAGSVQWEMKYCTRWRLGLTLIHFIRLMRKFPGALERMLPDDRCLATAVLSNLGDPTAGIGLPRRDGHVVSGNMTLQRIEALPPVRPMTRASFGLLWHGRRLTVALNYDARHLSASDGRELLAGFVRRISASMAEADHPSR